MIDRENLEKEQNSIKKLDVTQRKKILKKIDQYLKVRCQIDRENLEKEQSSSKCQIDIENLEK